MIGILVVLFVPHLSTVFQCFYLHTLLFLFIYNHNGYHYLLFALLNFKKKRVMWAFFSFRYYRCPTFNFDSFARSTFSSKGSYNYLSMKKKDIPYRYWFSFVRTPSHHHCLSWRCATRGGALSNTWRRNSGMWRRNDFVEYSIDPYYDYEITYLKNYLFNRGKLQTHFAVDEDEKKAIWDGRVWAQTASTKC